MSRRNSKSAKRWIKPIEELEQAFDAQVKFLRSSAAAYDRGETDEAVRLATAVYNLVHDGGQTCLLTQLQKRGSLRFISSGPGIIPGNLLPDMPLVAVRLSQTSSYVPIFDSSHVEPRLVQFHHWWEKEKIFRDSSGRSLARKNLVFALRNQEGGSHLDPTLSDETYIGVSRQNTAGWVVGVGPESESNMQPISPGPHLATMRQIAWELEKTLVDGGLVAPST